MRLEFGNTEHIHMARKAEVIDALVKKGYFVGVELEEVCGGCSAGMHRSGIIRSAGKKYLQCGECEEIIKLLT